MKRISYQVIFAFFLLLTSKVSAQSPNDTLLTIGKRSTTAGEFERIYKKNYNLNAAEKQSVNDYFDLFLKFKLKVSAALDEGLDTLPSFKKELKGYRDQLAKNYLTDNHVTDSLVREAYDRSQTEVNVSHILVLFPDNPTAADTLACYKKIADIRKKLLAGQSFEKLAEQYSDDPSAKKNKGNLGYFTVFRYPYVFESCAYRTKVGQVSDILRASYGYHLIKVNDRRPSRGQVKVAHIMCAVSQNAPDSVWQKGKERAYSVYERLKKGEDFARLARQVSDDRASAEKGGELPWFTTGRMVPEFEAAAFALKSKGEISQPIRTAFGWHILKLIDKRGVPSFDEVKNDYKSKIMSDERAEIIHHLFVEKLKKQNPYKIYSSNLSDFYNLDSSLYHGIVNLPKEATDKPLLTVRDATLTGADFSSYLKANPIAARKIPVKEYIDASFQKFVDNSFVTYEDQHLESIYPDFGNLISEYHDGILLFNIMDKEVWTKASLDTAGLEAFYNDKKDKPMWGERLNAAIFSCKTAQIAEKVKKLMSKGKNKNMTDVEILKAVCDTASRSACLHIERKLFSRGDNKAIDSLTWKPGIYEIKTVTAEPSLVYVWGTRPPEPKGLSDVRGLVIADYQNFLEEKWVDGLKNKYNVVINQDLLHKIADKYKN
jgi:peptidyl-prolyl cis-trans isomerase SurA